MVLFRLCKKVQTFEDIKVQIYYLGDIYNKTKGNNLDSTESRNANPPNVHSS